MADTALYGCANPECQRLRQLEDRQARTERLMLELQGEVRATLKDVLRHVVNLSSLLESSRA